MRSKKGGVVTGTVFGIGGLIIGVIVILIITSTIGNADLISNDNTNSVSLVNESVTMVGSGIVTLSTASLTYFSGYNATLVMNGTATTGLTNETLVEGVDYQIFSANGSIGNITTWDGGKAIVSYTFTTTDTYSNDVVDNMRANFTSGINNVSSKLPTILLIVAVVFLFGALVLLVRQAGLMGIGGSQGGSL